MPATTLSTSFDVLDPDFDAPLGGGHSFRELAEANRFILTNALWHRHDMEVDGANAALRISQAELVASLTASSHLLDPETARWAVRYMSYGVDSQQRGEDPAHFSLYRLPPDEDLLLLPHDFCVLE